MRRFNIGAVKTDLNAKERTLESRYHALDSAEGVRLLLGDYHALQARQYAGDYDAVVILIDMRSAMANANLTERQREALRMVFFDDMAQVDVAHKLRVSKQTVNRLVTVALAKVARVYEAWARMGEGYQIGEETA